MLVEPGSEEWARVISPSKVPSILGISRWQSAYSLWCMMAGLVEPSPPKDIFIMGHAMELAMAEFWRLDNPGWRLSPGEVQYATDAYGFPAVATLDRRASKGRTRKCIEFKIARDISEWGDEGGDECPQDYVAQVLAQMLFSGHHETADLLVLSGWYKHFTYHIEWDENVAKYIVQQCKKFYDSLGAKTPPELDDSEATYRTVKRLHPDINQGEVVDLPEDLYMSFLQAKQESSKWATAERGFKTRILDLMQNAQTATVNGERVATRSPGAKGSVTLRVR